MSLDRIEWIVKYLPDKTVGCSDLKDFFKIQNDERKIKVEDVDKNTKDYILDDTIFRVTTCVEEGYKKQRKVTDVYCLNGGV